MFRPTAGVLGEDIAIFSAPSMFLSQLFNPFCGQADESKATVENLEVNIPRGEFCQNGEESSALTAGRSSDGEASTACLFCADSGFHGFSKCSWCDGVPKPVKEELLETKLVLKRQTSTKFLILECSVDQSADSAVINNLVNPECKLCAADVANVVLRPCGHTGFCEDCIRRLVGAKSTAFCPYCRAPIQAFLKIDPKREVSVVHEEFQVKVSQWTR